MKKILALLLVFVMTFSFCASVTAQSVNNQSMGISLELSDNWSNQSGNDSLSFIHRNNSNEGIMIETVDNPMAWSLELLSEETLQEYCEELFSNSRLSDSLTRANGVYVSVSTDSVITSYETYNNVLYYRFEKAYTARAVGYLDTPFYETIYITAKNGKIYFISYARDYVSNHFQDVTAMLSTLSYDLGEIKIKIDNQRIYPDSAPMIISDRTLVPIRAIAEYMGYTVEWDGENQIVILYNADYSNILFYQIGNTTTLKNDQEIYIDVAPVIVNGRTYLPLRAVAEAMECDVAWDGATRTVLIAQ